MKNGIVIVLVAVMPFLSGCLSSAEGDAERETTESQTDSESTSTVLSLAASKSSVAPGETAYFYASGGVAPYTYLVYSGGGSVDASTGLFTAPAYEASTMVRVTDSAGTIAYYTLSIESSLAMTPASRSVSAGAILQLAASGGAAPYVFEIESGGGTLDSATNVYTAPSYADAVVIRVTDNEGRTTAESYTVLAAAALAANVAANEIDVDESTRITVSGGVEPYTLSITSGEGSISGNYYIAPATATVAKIRVQDSVGAVVTLKVTVKSLAMEEECPLIEVTQTTGLKRYGKLTTLNSSTICKVPVPDDASDDEQLSCPSGWSTVETNGYPYTITQDNGGSGYHSSLKAIARESQTVCTKKFLGICLKKETRTARVTDIACVK